MRIIREIREMQTISRKLRLSKKTIGFVPTMGAFHPGHLSLMKKARLGCDTVVVSIFVNPIQFGPNEDYEQYPRDFDRDCSLASKDGVDLIFMPNERRFYPDNYSTYVEVEKLGNALCGTSRPGHFRGVTTVVVKLFNIVRPNVAYFGQKDYQQALIISKMVRDLSFDVEIEILPIVRRRDGLAMSSRNAYLNKEEKRNARQLYQSLKVAEKLIMDGERNADTILSQMRQVLEPVARIDYLTISDSQTLQLLNNLDSGKILVALAAFIGKTRLIDNILLDIPK
jgi:pantoate--beta-alanine ligase